MLLKQSKQEGEQQKITSEMQGPRTRAEGYTFLTVRQFLQGTCPRAVLVVCKIQAAACYARYFPAVPNCTFLHFHELLLEFPEPLSLRSSYEHDMLPIELIGYSGHLPHAKSSSSWVFPQMLVSLEVFSWAFQPLVVFLLDPSLLLALRIQSQSPVFTMKNSDSNLTVSSFYFILHRDQSQGFVMRGSALPLSHSSYLFVSNNPSFLPGFDL